MNREILFRAKRVDTGEWVKGFLLPFNRIAHVDYFVKVWSEYQNDWIDKPYYEEVKIIPETVGQYTGLTDKNGVKIFEGDKDDRGNIVVFEKGMFLLKDENGFNRYLCEQHKFISIIGNIHDQGEQS